MTSSCCLQETVYTLEQITNDTISNIRSVIHTLRPPEMEAGIATALSDELARQGAAWRGSTSFESSLCKQNCSYLLDDTAMIELYRIGQELIANAIRHSKATLLKVELSCQQGTLQIEVVDNGEGFNVDPTYAFPGSHGLQGVVERASLIDAQVGIDSRPGSGTRATVALQVNSCPER
jgi:signal transduction histidine kinase